MKIAIEVKQKIRIKGFVIYLSKTDIVHSWVINDNESRAVFELEPETKKKELIEAIFGEWGKISYL